jgi:hypothetical protein
VERVGDRCRGVREPDAAAAHGDRGAADVEQVVFVVAADRTVEDRDTAEEPGERGHLFAHGGDDDRDRGRELH